MMQNFKANCGQFRGRTVLALCLVMLSSGGAIARAGEYRDMVEMPSVMVPAARQGLTLDIARAGDRLVAVGERGHVMLSDDAGQSWTQAQVDTRAQLNAVTFVDAEHGWAVGEDAVIVHTADGGQTWQRQYDGRDADMKGPLLDVWFQDTQTGFAMGVFNKIFKTTDGGASWVDWYDHVDNIDEWHLFAIAGSTDGAIYITSEAGLIFRSTDGGDNFVPVQTDHHGSFHGVLVSSAADGRDRLILTGVGGILYATTDGGENWTKLDSGTEAGLSGADWLPDGSAAVVGYGGVLLHIDPTLQTVTQHPQENGLPLSSVISLGQQGQLVLTGFGGPQTIDAPWRAN
jgi:photosystem II stability/assembly factor-like uncharacterized protein